MLSSARSRSNSWRSVGAFVVIYVYPLVVEEHLTIKHCRLHKRAEGYCPACMVKKRREGSYLLSSTCAHGAEALGSNKGKVTSSATRIGVIA